MKTNGFKFLDLLLEVSVLGMVLLVLSTCSDALGQLHFGFGCWDGFVDLRMSFWRGSGHTPGGRCQRGWKWPKTSRTRGVRVVTRVRRGARLWEKTMCWKVRSWEDSPTPGRTKDAPKLSGKLNIE